MHTNSLSYTCHQFVLRHVTCVNSLGFLFVKICIKWKLNTLFQRFWTFNPDVYNLSCYLLTLPNSGWELISSIHKFTAETEILSKVDNIWYCCCCFLSLIQGIFPTQKLNWGLLHCRWILYQLSYQARPPPLNIIDFSLSF